MDGKGPIVVTGATGRQGGAVARHLIDRGWAVRALVRDPDGPNAQELARRGAAITAGDLDDRESMKTALAGAYGVFSVQGFTGPDGVAGEMRQGRLLAETAAEAGVSHLVYSSVGGAERDTGIPHFASKWRIEQAIAALGLPATILRPVFFMENFAFMGPRPAGDELVLRLALRPQTTLQMIAVDDIGRIAATVFDRRGEYLGRAIEIAGDQLTGPRIAAEFAAAAGRPVRFEQQPRAELAAWSGEVATMFDWFDQAGYQADIPALRRHHPGLHTLADWLRESRWAPAG
ncbi:NmrA family transcriptional regulator [Sphaerisporangium rufum]|uniref:NmrA family transcriptional regulator n=1 Tax=Sphaerisporangium rufum TaxID=1381558 RepID=A0A919R7N0_9ACTN|nr:NmrA/HSCARG family protein [Sphaerisporangium rufum]GII81171.1 NmrA family transcriptional regulator [Sphaerisporangium rufum]